MAKTMTDEPLESPTVLKVRLFGYFFPVPACESMAASKTRETPSQQPLHAIPAGSPMFQHGGLLAKRGALRSPYLHGEGNREIDADNYRLARRKGR
jgi:hypothetical protein